MNTRRKILGGMVIVVVAGSLFLIYPEQTKEFFASFLDNDFPFSAQIWRVTTKNSISRKDIQVDYCLLIRNGEVLGEPDDYRKGWVEFNTHPVAEFDNLSLSFEKIGYIPLNITFIVPRLPGVGGQTYYSFYEAKLYPIPPIGIIPWIVEYYCENNSCCEKNETVLLLSRF